MDGMINIYKKKGFTSHDVVAKARGILKERRIGHAGTLDPEAEGVLLLCIGKATKAVPYLTDEMKGYEAEVILGQTTTTEDATGDVLETHEVTVTKEQVEEVVSSFVGPYIQTPPMYSAIKVNGVRLYELARKGIEIQRPSRKVILKECKVIEWLDANRFRIKVYCSKGTYMRTLCTDIGKKLGCGAHMGYLLRTQVGHFKLEESITLETLETHKMNVTPYLYTLEDLFKQYQKAQVTQKGLKRLLNGNTLSCNDLVSPLMLKDQEIICLYDKTFKALYKWNEKSEQLEVEKMF